MRPSLLCALLLALPIAAAAAPKSKSYPTVDRVLYVHDCMQAHPGPYYEMTNKCSCAIDSLARQVPYDQYVTMSTATNANSIGGERGSYIRDTPELQRQIKRYKELQTKALKGCFIEPEAK